MGDQATKPSSGNRKHTGRMNPLFQRVWTRSSVVITLDVSRVRPHPRPSPAWRARGAAMIQWRWPRSLIAWVVSRPVLCKLNGFP